MKSTTAITVLFLLLLFEGRLAFAEDQVREQCHLIANKLASVSYAECMRSQLVASDGYSVNNTPILIREFPAFPERHNLHGRVLLVGGIHGDEYASVTIVFKWMQLLEQNHPDLFHWHILPLLNPDGLLQKNSRRKNANGVDLNSNFPTLNWQEEAYRYWQEEMQANPHRYPGENALSEPETRWLVAEIDRFKPDVIVSVHAPNRVIDYNSRRNEPYNLARLYTNTFRTYPGSLDHYAGVQEKIPVITIELPFAGIMPKPGEVDYIWTDLVNRLTDHLLHKQSGVETAAQDVWPDRN